MSCSIMKINCHIITLRLIHWIKINCNGGLIIDCKLKYAGIAQCIGSFLSHRSRTWDLFVNYRWLPLDWQHCLNRRSSVQPCQIMSSQTCCTHLQLPAGWAFSQLWRVLLKTALLCLGARVLHIWMSDTFMHWSVSLDSNDYFLMGWQVDDR